MRKYIFFITLFFSQLFLVLNCNNSKPIDKIENITKRRDRIIDSLFNYGNFNKNTISLKNVEDSIFKINYWTASKILLKCMASL